MFKGVVPFRPIRDWTRVKSGRVESGPELAWLSFAWESGARFSKVPIINGPGKLLPFTLKIEVSIVLHLT